MRIVLNGAWREVAGNSADAAGAVSGNAAATLDGADTLDFAAGATLQALLCELGFGVTVATAVNGEFVPQGARARRVVREGDRIEVLSPMQGG
ncbi:MAG TPA: sulfur carrier protein ThiS [Steroidobacteraceae bacterium]|jgi:sulfur carrier protein|nr:sulfur carrier protein ThiS [Steroidobacteraceae bacterium]